MLQTSTFVHDEQAVKILRKDRLISSGVLSYIGVRDKKENGNIDVVLI